jgi:hypothetical protein
MKLANEKWNPLGPIISPSFRIWLREAGHQGSSVRRVQIETLILGILEIEAQKS